MTLSRDNHCLTALGANDACAPCVDFGVHQPHARTSPSLTMPHTIGRFRVIRSIGRGASGDVYLAHDEELGEVALKVLHGVKPGALARLMREADTLRKLKHPNILGTYEIAPVGDVLYLCMRYVPGPTLAVAPPTVLADCVAMIRDVCRAAEYAHQHGIVHRDIKPSNVLLDPVLGPQLADFGSAKDLSELADDTLTARGALVGTPGYLSPEQARGQSVVTAATDIYGLGATLYFLLTRRVPHEADSVAESLMIAVNGHVARPAAIYGDIPRDLEAIVVKAMSLDPKRRFACAQDMADELQAYLRGKPVRSTFEVFARDVADAQEQGWRVRRLVCLVTRSVPIHLSSARTGRYELVVVDSCERAAEIATQRPLDVLAISDEFPWPVVESLVTEASMGQPDLVRVVVYSRVPAIPLLQQLINGVGLDRLVDAGEPGDPLGTALDHLFTRRRDHVVSVREQLRMTQRKVRALEASLAQKTADLEATSAYHHKQTTELERLRRAIINVSVELRDKTEQLRYAQARIAELSPTNGAT